MNDDDELQRKIAHVLNTPPHKLTHIVGPQSVRLFATDAQDVIRELLLKLSRYEPEGAHHD